MHLIADDANSITVANDTPIAIWYDISGHGNNAVQSTPARMPIFKYAASTPQAVNFSSSDFLVVPVAARMYNDSSYTFMVVANGSDHVYCESSDYTLGLYRFTTGWASWTDYDSDPTNRFPTSGNYPYPYTYTIMSANQDSNCVMFATNDYNVSPDADKCGMENWDRVLTYANIGIMQRSSFSNPFIGNIHEFIVFGNKLSDSDRVTWYNYLQRWNCLSTPTPTPEVTATPCELIENYDFGSSSNWTLGGDAIITPGKLILPGTNNSSASQIVTLPITSSYNAIIHTQIYTVENIIDVGLDVYVNPVYITTPGIYDTTFYEMQPITYTYSITNPSDNDDMIISYTCLFLSDAAYTPTPIATATPFTTPTSTPIIITVTATALPTYTPYPTYTPISYETATKTPTLTPSATPTGTVVILPTAIPPLTNTLIISDFYYSLEFQNKSCYTLVPRIDRINFIGIEICFDWYALRIIIFGIELPIYYLFAALSILMVYKLFIATVG